MARCVEIGCLEGGIVDADQFTDEARLLRAPLFATAWDFDSRPVLFPGATADPPPKTGDPTAPAVWIEFRVEYDPAAYRSFSGAEYRRIDGRVKFRIHQEPALDDQPLRVAVDDLEAAYGGQDIEELIFFPRRARPEFQADDDWLVCELKLPFTRFDRA